MSKIITVIGEYRVGKSSLINFIVDNRVMKTSDYPISCTTWDDNLVISLNYKQEYNNNIHETSLHFYDTPGFEEDDENYVVNQLYIIATKFATGSNIFLFVMRKGLFSQNTKKLLSIIDEKYGKSFWNRCILCYTGFDDEYKLTEIQCQNTKDDYYNNLLDKTNKWTNEIIEIESNKKDVKNRYATYIGLFDHKVYLCTYDNTNIDLFISFKNSVKNGLIISRKILIDKILQIDVNKNYKIKFLKLTMVYDNKTKTQIIKDINNFYYEQSGYIKWVPIANLFSNENKYIDKIIDKEIGEFYVEKKITYKYLEYIEKITENKDNNINNNNNNVNNYNNNNNDKLKTNYN